MQDAAVVQHCLTRLDPVLGFEVHICRSSDVYDLWPVIHRQSAVTYSRRPQRM
jgi:hypothetical protein